jgi:hypothetical protein
MPKGQAPYPSKRIASTTTPPSAELPVNTDGIEEIVVTGKRTNTPDVKPSILPNMLDEYETYTYHFKLYVMAESAFSAGKNAAGPTSKERKIILAESGVTAVSIDDVSFTSIIGMSKATGATSALEFQFTLTQPHGATVLDYFAYANQQLGNKNWMKAPYFLELTFRARSPEGTTDQKPIKDNALANLVWVFPLIITQVDVNVNTGGSAYVVTASAYNNLAFTNQAFDLESSTTIESSTVGEFYEQLQEKLNAREIEKITSGQYVADQYEFFIAPEFVNEALVSGNIDELANRSGAYAVEGTDKVGLSFQPATSIDHITKSVLSLTDYLKKASRGQADPDVVSEEGIGRAAATQKLYKIVSDTQVIRWDAGRRDYARKFRYLIIPYDYTTLQTPSNETAGLNDQQRYDMIANTLRKEYNYIYTGLNDQVLDFDLTFNMAWYAAMSIQAGISTSASIAEPGAVLTEHTQEKQIENQDNKVKEKEQQANTSTSSSMSALEAATKEGSYNERTSVSDDLLKNTQGAFDRAARTAGVFGGNERTLYGSQPGINVGIEDQLGTFSSTEFLEYGKKQRYEEIKKSIGTGLDTPLLQDTTTYVERVIEREVEVEKYNPLIVSYVESDFGQNMNASGDTLASPGRSLLSSLFSQAENAMTGDLLSISLKIKGDPYWIEPPPVGKNAQIQSILDRELAKRGMGGNVEEFDEVADYSSGQAYFIFRSITAAEWDPVTGLYPPGSSKNNIISGIYGVVKVGHQFSQGQFTQTLEAVRNPKININNLKVNNTPLPGKLSLTSLSGDLSLPAFNLDGIDPPAAVTKVLDAGRSAAGVVDKARDGVAKVAKAANKIGQNIGGILGGGNG